nr:unnamed protein product [Digitaria exilis]
MSLDRDVRWWLRPPPSLAQLHQLHCPCARSHPAISRAAPAAHGVHAGPGARRHRRRCCPSEGAACHLRSHPRSCAHVAIDSAHGGPIPLRRRKDSGRAGRMRTTAQRFRWRGRHAPSRKQPSTQMHGPLLRHSSGRARDVRPGGRRLLRVGGGAPLLRRGRARGGKRRTTTAASCHTCCTSSQILSFSSSSSNVAVDGELLLFLVTRAPAADPLVSSGAGVGRLEERL